MVELHRSNVTMFFCEFEEDSMKKRSKSLLCLVLMAILVFAMAISVSAATATPSLNKTSITIPKSSTYTLKVNHYKGKIQWKSANTAIATVSSKGVVTAKKNGSTTITVTCGSKKLKCKVKVQDPKISKTSYTMAKGSKYTLKISEFTGTVKWKSSNTAIATVSSKGEVVAKKKGSVTITAQCGKAKKTCKIKVEDPKISKTETTLKTLGSATLSVSGTSSKVTWSTSNKSIVTVSSKGKIAAIKPGTATITAKVLGKSLKCKVTVKPNFTASDYSVTKGTLSKLVEFEFDPSVVSKSELEAEGFTVTGNIARKTAIVNTATYTFKCLPKTLDELKAIKLDTMFGPMAAAIVTLPTWKNMPASEGMYKHPIYDWFTYCQGGNAISNVDRSSMYTVMQRTLSSPSEYNNADNGRYAYFKGATPANSYTPSKPLTFTLEEGPYIIPAKYGNPERHMVLISFGGDSYQRYCDVYYSTKNSKWFLFLGQWKHLVADFIDPIEEWMPAPEDMDSSIMLEDSVEDIDISEEAILDEQAIDEEVEEELISDEVISEDDVITDEEIFEDTVTDETVNEDTVIE